MAGSLILYCCDRYTHIVVYWFDSRTTWKSPMESGKEQVLPWSGRGWKGCGQLMKNDKVKMKKRPRTCKLLLSAGRLIVKLVARNDANVMVTDEVLYAICQDWDLLTSFYIVLNCWSFLCWYEAHNVTSLTAQSVNLLSECGLLIAFSALMLLLWRQEEHPTCKNWMIRCWHSYLSAAKCRWSECGPADATATP